MKRRNQSGGIVAVVLITALILASLAVLGLLSAGWFVAHNVRVTEKTSRRETTVETPFGSFRVRENARLDPRHLGIPVYPGAVREDDRNKIGSFEFDFGSNHKEFSVVAAEYTTSDPFEQVKEYYRRELPHWMFSARRHGGVQMELTESGYKRIIAIHEENGRTHIGLASLGEPAAN